MKFIVYVILKIFTFILLMNSSRSISSVLFLFNILYISINRNFLSLRNLANFIIDSSSGTKLVKLNIIKLWVFKYKIKLLVFILNESGIVRMGPCSHLNFLLCCTSSTINTKCFKIGTFYIIF